MLLPFFIMFKWLKRAFTTPIHKHHLSLPLETKEVEKDLHHYVDMLRRELYSVTTAYAETQTRLARLERLIFDNKLSNDKIDSILKAFELCQTPSQVAMSPGSVIYNNATNPGMLTTRSTASLGIPYPSSSP